MESPENFDPHPNIIHAAGAHPCGPRFDQRTITAWQIILLSVVLGCVNAVGVPTRQSFVIHMIEDRNDLGNVIALNSAMFNATRFLGPSVAGILIALTGEGMCFLINGLSYLVAIAALMAMNIPHIPLENKNKKVLHDLKEGFVYAYNEEPIRLTLLILALTSIIGIPYMVLMPAFARDILHGGPHTLGFLMSSSGAGALLGALYLASRKSPRGLMRNIPYRGRYFWYWINRILAYPHPLVFHSTHSCGRLRHDDPDRIKQYTAPNYCAG
ncbi:MAG: MFS transporter [Syntrophales bacterium]